MSLTSMAERTLGNAGARVAGVTYLFLHYALLVACAHSFVWVLLLTRLWPCASSPAMLWVGCAGPSKAKCAAALPSKPARLSCFTYCIGSVPQAPEPPCLCHRYSKGGQHCWGRDGRAARGGGRRLYSGLQRAVLLLVAAPAGPRKFSAGGCRGRLVPGARPGWQLTSSTQDTTTLFTVTWSFLGCNNGGVAVLCTTR